MEVKETQDLWVLRKRSRLRIRDVKTSAAQFAVTIEEQIVEAGLEIAGPYIFISHNLPKDSKGRNCRKRPNATLAPMANLAYAPPAA